MQGLEIGINKKQDSVNAAFVHPADIETPPPASTPRASAGLFFSFSNSQE
jgi:hypothetical protein